MKEKKIVNVGNLYGFTGGSFAGMIYSAIGICPTINTAGGGNREPMIIEANEESIRDIKVEG